jgi:hypothetical protein
VTTNTSPHPAKTRVTTFFQWSLKVFIMIQHTQGEVNHEDGQVPKPISLDDIQWGDRTKCLHVSVVGVQRHRPSHVVESTTARVPTFVPHDQSVPGYTCRLRVSWETLYHCGTSTEWLPG